MPFTVQAKERPMNNKTATSLPSKNNKAKASIDLVKEAKCLADAKRFLAQENYTQALHSYQQLVREGAAPEIAQQIHLCQMQLLRRYVKQGKNELFVTARESYGWKDHLALPLARMQGEEALKKLTEEDNAIDATLAACTLEKDLKLALTQLRKLPLYKEMAEGWICLLKGNFSLAKSAFDIAGEKVPHAARVGHALIQLAMGQKDEANKSLETFRPLLSRCLPKFSQEMGWKQATTSDGLFRSLFYASSEQIAAALKQYKTLLSNQEKGWLFLRAGDLLWMKQQKSRKDIQWNLILSYWSDAMYTHSPLRMDVAKRRMILANKCEFLDTASEWKNLCTLLEQLDKQKLDDYLTYSAQVSHCDFIPIPIKTFYTKSSHLRKKQKWILSAPPLSFYLLFCRQITHQLRYFDQAVQIPRQLTPQDLPALFNMVRNDDDESFNWDWKDLEECLALLDQTHMKEPLYLKMRYTIARLTNHAEQILLTLYNDLLQDPSQKDLLMPHYLTAFFKELNDLEGPTRIDATPKKELSLKNIFTFFKSRSSKHSLGERLRQSPKQADRLEQLKQFHQKFPNDYDVTRLMLLCQYDASEVQNQLITHTGHLPRQLVHLLRCQIMVDTGESQKAVLSVLPNWNECQGNPEAQERWLQLALSPLLESEERWQMILNDLPLEELHLMLKRIEARGENVPYNFIATLAEMHTTPYATYHGALSILRNDLSIGSDVAIQGLSCYEDYCNEKNHPDYASASATYYLFSTVSILKNEEEEEEDMDSFF